MNPHLILASGSQIRADLLRAAGVPFTVTIPRVDESSIRAALEAEGASPRDMADALAEYKARRVSDRQPGAFVLGCDQILTCDGVIYAKPESPEDARAQLLRLRGQRHQLLSAAVIYQDGEPVWRHVGVARLLMREFSDAYLDEYLARNWDSLRHAVGGYKLEEEGVRLFSRIEGDHFTILGLPLLELLAFFNLRGIIAA
ncbi:Maf family protein [Salipiger marinus]|uniref:Maf family protein n=1 Tax=Salipiger marinus TaxID=555512 RepID=UPI001E412216|nr:Maf family nucleotide pyrophosphatase [Salipiger manganoxidans]MCD1617321.1 Maf family nucleotide pyrophosphatase [Salipiger manganoxidans]MEB3417375.1 Maf family nucleotide pyrophosphatase [Salipiger manganoxidans]